jgi:GR25 family glycosyltransferase involved in LPS biosynthesis
MSIILQKIGPCSCPGICDGNCSALIKPAVNLSLPPQDAATLQPHISHMELLFKKINIPDQDKIVFITAISPDEAVYRRIRRNRRKVSEDYIPRCYCLEEPCNRHHARSLREVEIAICLSHLRVYKQILKNKDELALVTEDDILLVPNVFEILQHVLEPILSECLSDKPIIIFLGGSKTNPDLQITQPNKFELTLSKSGVYSNYCYLINAAAARLLKKNIWPIKRPDDSYKRFLILKGFMTAYQVTPSLVAELSAGINAKSKYQRLSKH